MGHDGGENLLRFDNFREEVGPSNGRLRSPAGGKTAISRFESILLSLLSLLSLLKFEPISSGPRQYRCSREFPEKIR